MRNLIATICLPKFCLPNSTATSYLVFASQGCPLNSPGAVESFLDLLWFLYELNLLHAYLHDVHLPALLFARRHPLSYHEVHILADGDVIFVPWRSIACSHHGWRLIAPALHRSPSTYRLSARRKEGVCLYSFDTAAIGRERCRNSTDFRHVGVGMSRRRLQNMCSGDRALSLCRDRLSCWRLIAKAYQLRRKRRRQSTQSGEHDHSRYGGLPKLSRLRTVGIQNHRYARRQLPNTTDSRLCQRNLPP
jgi:hypothetical protein